jgi:hypothetical protein
MGIRSFSPKAKGRPFRFRRAALGALILVALVLVVAIARNISRHDDLVQWRARLEAEAGNPPWPDWSSKWPPFAATHQELLRTIPCYCGCVRDGHQSVLQCFLTGSSVDNSPIWTDHSFDCEMCVHIVREVFLMTSQRLPPTVIRGIIESKYRAVGNPTRTPLPAPDAHH